MPETTTSTYTADAVAAGLSTHPHPTPVQPESASFPLDAEPADPSPRKQQQVVPGAPLTPWQRTLLDFAELTTPMPPGRRERHIREHLRMSPTQYFQRLNALLDKPAAWEAKPVLMRILATRRQRNRDRYW
ncbi:DUF3263 domain-containing protein [Streptomyces sp. NPDC059783]|uniref:DUF3263 domain-containing protein n=1 Tax=Streptomyces sp. NPDC059783 TaxID=3346944 RepID=UPI003647C9F7